MRPSFITAARVAAEPPPKLGLRRPRIRGWRPSAGDVVSRQSRTQTAGAHAVTFCALLQVLGDGATHAMQSSSASPPTSARSRLRLDVGSPSDVSKRIARFVDTAIIASPAPLKLLLSLGAKSKNDPRSVKEVSTGRCWRTFRVGNVVLHVHAAHPTSHSCYFNSPANEERVSAAHAAFARHGLIQPRLAEGSGSTPDYFIEPFLNGTRVGVGVHRDLDAVDAIAKLLARVHSIPTDWYTPYRQQLLRRLPPGVGEDIPHGSHLWWFGSSRPGNYLRDLSGVTIREWSMAGPHPFLSKAAARIVTTHGDFQPSNLLRTKEDNGIALLDLEFACVTSAALDLGLFFTYLHGEKSRNLFARSYLMAVYPGSDPSPKEMDNLILDSTRFATLHWPGGQGSASSTGRSRGCA